MERIPLLTELKEQVFFLAVVSVKKEVSVIFPKHMRNSYTERFLRDRSEYILSKHW